MKFLKIFFFCQNEIPSCANGIQKHPRPVQWHRSSSRAFLNRQGIATLYTLHQVWQDSPANSPIFSLLLLFYLNHYCGNERITSLSDTPYAIKNSLLASYFITFLSTSSSLCYVWTSFQWQMFWTRRERTESLFLLFVPFAYIHQNANSKPLNFLDKQNLYYC